MNEQQLKDFGTHAETLVEIPDFAELDRRGHGLRVRRRVGVAGALAMMLTVAGVVAQTHRNPANVEPIKPPDQSNVRAYPRHGSALPAGTYRLRPSLADRHLVAEVTVPPGWSAWVGPQSGRKDWYVNALILEIDKVSTTRCLPEVQPLETPEEVVAALAQAYSTKLVRGPEPEDRFGYPATRMRLRVTTEAEKTCPDNTQSTFHATEDGEIGFAPAGTRLDIWVVDVDGRPIYVQRAQTPNAPRFIRKELNGVIDSIQLKTAE